MNPRTCLTEILHVLNGPAHVVYVSSPSPALGRYSRGTKTIDGVEMKAGLFLPEGASFTLANDALITYALER
jgi:hypothetical protein